MHSIAYIAGLPRIVLDYVCGCNDPESVGHFKERFREFAESVVTCSLLVSVGEQEPLPCQTCGALNSIEPMKETPPDAYRSLPRYAKPPPTSQCSSCSVLFDGVQVLPEK